MASRIRVDFDNVYELDEISPDFKLSSFKTILTGGTELPLVVKISNHPHELIPDVYNMAFGPLNKQGKIDDKAELTHADYSKVFSTILFAAYAYLEQHPTHILGIDGSDNARAYYYFRAIMRNFSYLDQHFVMYGIKYFVRITRLGRTQYDNPFDFEDVIPYPDRLIAEHRVTQDLMYNYFIFTLKDNHTGNLKTKK